MKLRPIRPADAPRIQQLVEDPAVRAFTNMPDPYPEDGAARWIEEAIAARAVGEGFDYSVVTGDGLVGVCGVRRVGGEPRSGILGYWIGRPYWGSGLATEAVRRVVRLAFDEHGLEMLEASCHEAHAASRRVLEKNGFRFVGRGPEDHPKWSAGDVFAHFRRVRRSGS